jgi:succinate dehydrogenase/fumarate reductase cytochrome b subunit
MGCYRYVIVYHYLYGLRYFLIYWTVYCYVLVASPLVFGKAYSWDNRCVLAGVMAASLLGE